MTGGAAPDPATPAGGHRQSGHTSEGSDSEDPSRGSVTQPPGPRPHPAFLGEIYQTPPSQPAVLLTVNSRLRVSPGLPSGCTPLVALWVQSSSPKSETVREAPL